MSCFQLISCACRPDPLSCSCNQLQDLSASLVELWSLMDTPVGEQQMFEHVTKNIAASDNEITEPNLLSMKNIKYV